MQTFIISSVLLLFLFLQFAKSEGDADYISEAIFCLQKLNLERSEMEKVIGDEENDIPDNNLEFNNFAACYMEKKGFLNARGEINYALIIEAIAERHEGKSFSQKFDRKNIRHVIKACKDVPPGNSKGQTLVKVFNCLTRKVKECANTACAF